MLVMDAKMATSEYLERSGGSAAIKHRVMQTFSRVVRGMQQLMHAAKELKCSVACSRVEELEKLHVVAKTKHDFSCLQDWSAKAFLHLGEDKHASHLPHGALRRITHPLQRKALDWT